MSFSVKVFLVSAEVAERILQYVDADYFANYAVVAYVTDVRAVRGDTYV